ncbi:MAG: hypothetical protein U0324_30505 [Polyangiales bacterium]
MSTAALDQVHAFQAMVNRAREDAIRSARLSYTGVGVALGVAAVVALALVVAGRAPNNVAAGALVAALMSGLCLRLASAFKRPEELARTGLPATATLERVVGGGLNLRVSNSSMQGNIAQTRARMTITVEGRAPYSVVVTDFLPGGAYGRLVPGTSFAAHVDPTRPDRVLVDWSA